MAKPELDMLLRQAMDRVNVGDVAQGRRLLEVILEKDPHNDQAWVWLSACVDDPHHRRICLQQALRANPRNQVALDGMRVLDGELIQIANPGPSLVESRLAAIGVGADESEGSRAPSLPPANPAQQKPEEPAAERGTDARGSGNPMRLVLLICLVVILGVSTLGLLAYYVILPQLGM